MDNVKHYHHKKLYNHSIFNSKKLICIPCQPNISMIKNMIGERILIDVPTENKIAERILSTPVAEPSYHLNK